MERMLLVRIIAGLKSLLSVLIVFGTIAFGVWQHKTASVQVLDQQLMIRCRQISRVTFFVQKHRIQMLEARQSYFQKRIGMVSAKVSVMGNLEGVHVKIKHQPQERMQEILQLIAKKRDFTGAP